MHYEWHMYEENKATDPDQYPYTQNQFLLMFLGCCFCFFFPVWLTRDMVTFRALSKKQLKGLEGEVNYTFELE